MGGHPFHKGISSKVNVIPQVELEFVYDDIVV